MSDVIAPPTPSSPDREGLPSFAKDYPDDADLLNLARAFERGDFGGVKRAAPGLLSAKSDPEVLKAIHELVSRTRPDPLSIALIALTALLLIALSSYWMLHNGPEAQHSPSAPSSR